MKLIILLTLGMITFGCVTQRSRKGINVTQASTVFDVGFEKAWKALTEVVGKDMYLPLTVMDKKSGTIETEMVSISASRLTKVAITAENKAIDPLVWLKGRYKLNCLLKKKGTKKTKLLIESYIEGWLTDEWLVCKSRGIIEREIFLKIHRKVQNQ